jgi:hypothetical protein
MHASAALLQSGGAPSICLGSVLYHQRQKLRVVYIYYCVDVEEIKKKKRETRKGSNHFEKYAGPYIFNVSIAQ